MENIEELRAEVARLRQIVGEYPLPRESPSPQPELEGQFQSLVENIPGAVYRCLLDEDWTMCYLSNFAERLTGHPSSDFIASKVRTWSSIMHPDDREMASRIVEESLQRDGRFAVEYRIIDASEKVRWVFERGVVLPLAEGGVQFLDGVILEITQFLETRLALNNARHELELNRRTIQTYLDSSLDFIFIKDTAGRFIDCNEPYARLVGRRRDEVIGQQTVAIFGKSFGARFDAEDRKVVQSRKSHMTEQNVTYPDGRILRLQTHKSPIFGDTGDVEAIIGIARDVTELRRTEAALRRAERTMRAALEAANIGVWDRNLIDGTVEFSPEWRKLMGLKPGELPATEDQLGARIHPDDREELREALRLYLDAASPEDAGFFEKRFRMRAGDGRYKWILSRGEIIEWHALKPARMAGTHLDISGIVEAEEKAREARDAAEKANRAKSVFLANMTHEIRTPMNSILGYAQILMRDSALTAAQKKAVSTLNRSGEHLLRLINDILEVARIESGHVELVETSVDLRRMLPDVEAMFLGVAHQKQLHLSLSIADSLPEAVICDEFKLRQILINLIGNALKFTDSGSIEIIASAQAAGSPGEDVVMLEFDVQDTGMGIRHEEISTIFEKFSRVGTALTDGGGTGLGLTICREYAALMGGCIDVSSAPGVGSCFTLRVPARRTEHGDFHHTTRRTVSLSPASAPCRVLIADDHASNRDILQLALDSMGFETRVVSHGRAAVEVFGAWSPHLILMDVRMPVMDGMEAIARIRRAAGGGNVCIFAVTASVYHEDESRLTSTGANRLVRKPVHFESLCELIEEEMGLEFLREDLVEELGAAVPAREELESLPEELRAGLSDAIVHGNLARVSALASQIADHDADLAHQLQRMADEYQLNELAKIAQWLASPAESD